MKSVHETTHNNLHTQMSAQPRPPMLNPAKPERTFGQKLADRMASKVGSWAFIGAQSVILTGWIGANTIPGLPHWDESPFILLNLVFSFASAYTAPVVLMSQNRQSEEDRESAEINHQVNLHTAQEIELLHQKIDNLHTSTLQTQSHQLSELVELLRQQAGAHSDQAVQPSYQYLARPSAKPIAAKSQEFSNSVMSPYNPQTHLQTKHKFDLTEVEAFTPVQAIPVQAKSISDIPAK